MANDFSSKTALDILKQVFSDQPELLSVVTLGDVESEKLLGVYQQRSNVFATHVNLYVVGRTGSGKTSLGNSLFGNRHSDLETMRSTGHIDCTDYIGVLRLKSNLWYFDTPGAGSSEEYENITRAALRLKPLEDNVIASFKVQDFTEAKKVNEKITGIVEGEETVKAWASEEKYLPDVILYIVAPHMQFLRDDRIYLRDMLRVHKEKVVIALNIWFGKGVQVTTPENIADAKKYIAQTYEVSDVSIVPRFAEFNALTGTGINDITTQICSLIPQEKLGNIQSVLRDELKEFAAKERDRRFYCTLNRIAARLALYTVDQRTGNQDLISVAASGVAQYAVTTFKDIEAIAEIRDELDTLYKRQAEEIKEKRSQILTRSKVNTIKQDITDTKPIIKEFESEQKEVVEVNDTIIDREKRSLWKRLWSDWDRHYTVTTKKEPREIEHITKKIEQKVVGYEKKVLKTVDAVVSVTEEEIGKKALEGGLPVIEFLIGIGLGIKHYCLDTAMKAGAQTHIVEQQQSVQLALGTFRAQLEELLEKGGSAEEEIIQILDAKLAGN